METTILEDLGFTNAEIKVYLALLELGASTAGPIIDKSGLQNSVVHMTLHKLVDNGFASFVKKGKVKHYEATDPRNILKFIDEKKERFKEILPQLMARQEQKKQPEAEVYVGFKGFKNMNYELIEDAKKGDEYLFFSFNPSKPEKFENIFNFYREFDKNRVEKGIIVKGIAPTSLRESLKNRIGTKIILVDFPTPSNISICNDKVAFTPLEEEQVCFLIRSRQLAQSFRRYFYSIWDKYGDEKTRKPKKKSNKK